ncbi:hypothetical protein ACFYRN_16510 [Streptomyces sp. NPDC005227]|uniref:hypothetical protein n=1 Tax=Streptomyces sp. NPDC005227 TaxID=3364707 RepID=UPI0036A84989
MTAIEERTTVTPGKSTHDRTQRSVDEATRTLTLPHLPYADAVVAELDAVCMPPAAVEVGMRDPHMSHPELFLRAVWPAGASALDERVQDQGLSLSWSHVTGWSAHDADSQCVLLDLDTLADPRLIAHAALHFAEEPLTGGETWTPPPGPDRWAFALELDIALVNFEERETR